MYLIKCDKFTFENTKEFTLNEDKEVEFIFDINLSDGDIQILNYK